MTEGFLSELNWWAGFFNSTLMQDCEVERPFIFVVGAPRSGTTVLTQVLAHALDLGYVCNLAARFWLAPLVGIRLAREVLGANVTPGFSSNYAVTPEAAGIHEFGYFWRYWLGCETRLDTPDGEGVNWERLRLTLANVQRELGKPVVMKGIWPAYVAPQVNEMLGDNAWWVNVERDPVDNCISVLEGRRQRGGEREWCCGWVPPEPEFGRLRALDDPYRQIARQVVWLRDHYRSIAHVTVTLEELCKDPTAVARSIAPHWPFARTVPPGALRLKRFTGRPVRARFEEILWNS